MENGGIGGIGPCGGEPTLFIQQLQLALSAREGMFCFDCTAAHACAQRSQRLRRYRERLRQWADGLINGMR
jgi:hypothetical protein